jgi:hypothetical protein
LPNKARVDRLLNKVIDMSRLQVTDWLGKQWDLHNENTMEHSDQWIMTGFHWIPFASRKHRSLLFEEVSTKYFLGVSREVCFQWILETKRLSNHKKMQRMKIWTFPRLSTCDHCQKVESKAWDFQVFFYLFR